jgi:hypothetical protein
MMVVTGQLAMFCRKSGFSKSPWQRKKVDERESRQGLLRAVLIRDPKSNIWGIEQSFGTDVHSMPSTLALHHILLDCEM